MFKFRNQVVFYRGIMIEVSYRGKYGFIMDGDFHSFTSWELATQFIDAGLNKEKGQN